MTAKTRALVDAVQAHAHANYETGGWDFVVECLTDDEIADKLGDAKDAGEAIARVGAWAKLHAEARAEVEAEIF